MITNSGVFCRGRGGHGGCAKDGSSWWASPAWASGLAGGLALSVLPRTAKLVVLHVISNEKENLRAEVDATDESDGLQVEVIPFRQDDQPHPAPKRNKHLRLSQSTNQYINHHSITIPPPSYNRTRNRRTDGSTVTKLPRTYRYGVHHLRVRRKSTTERTVGRESRWDGERRTLNAASS